MDSLIKSAKKISRGFSITEIIIVLAIIGLLLSISSSVYGSFKTHQNLEIVTSGVVEAIRSAQAHAQAGKNDSSWGVEILPTSVVIFKGTSYASRDTSADQSLNFAQGVSSSGIHEIVFTKISGSTIDAGTITLVNSYGTKNIVINAKGTLTF